MHHIKNIGYKYLCNIETQVTGNGLCTKGRAPLREQLLREISVGTVVIRRGHVK